MHSPSKILAFAAWLVALPACTRTLPNDFGPPRLPECAGAMAIVSEPRSDEERLRAEVQKAAVAYMSGFDRFMRGELAAYEATATIEGKTFGPMRGVVREETVDEKLRASLTLEGAPNHSITISPRTELPGDVLVQAPFRSEFSSPLIVCKGCSDDRRLNVRALYDESLDWVSEEQVPANVPGGRKTVQQKVRVKVSIKRIEPANIDISLARTLFALPESSMNEPARYVFPFSSYDPPYAVVSRPATIDSKYGSCELTFREPPRIELNTACLANWRVESRDGSLRTRCCTQPPYHGPPRSGHVREDCVSHE